MADRMKTEVPEHPRILVVDDDAELLRAVRLSLAAADYDVLCVGSSVEALPVIRRTNPHLIVLDVMMPDVDGWQILSAVRQEPAPVSGALVLMLTAKDSLESKVTGFTLGADDYLVKPFSVQELRLRVAALLRRYGTSDRAGSRATFTVVNGASGQVLLAADDVFYFDGVRNYSYAHTWDDKRLCKLRLHEVEEAAPNHFMRVHRSFIVNGIHVRGGRWVNNSSYHLVLADKDRTEIPVSRRVTADVRRELGLS